MKHGIPLIDAIADPPYRTYAQLGLARVPNTLLVGANSMVEQVWAGQMDPAGWNEMFAYFGERQVAPAAASTGIGAMPAGCGPGSADASAKNCR